MLNSRLFAGNARLAQAENNAPAMSRGERNADAVRLIQQAMRDLEIASMRRSIRSDRTFDGDYSGETFRAVKKFQVDCGLAPPGGGDGIVGRDTLGALDARALRAGLVPQTAVAAAAAAPPVETPTTLARRGTPRLPSAADLEREYRRFRDSSGKPCRATRTTDAGDVVGITNQCAIRLSIALGRCDIGFHMVAADGVRMYVHSADSRHSGGHIEVPHEARAQRLFDHLSSFWTFVTYRVGRRGTMTGAEVYETVKTQPGLVFFDDIGASSATSGGDHIDFFNGTRIMNDLMNYAGSDEPRGRAENTTFAAARTANYFLPINP